MVMAGIILIRNLFIFGPDFFAYYFVSPEITNEKISAGMIGFGTFLILVGFRKKTN